ncbi:MAG: hypothetical protein HY506_02425 [Candidatus Yanofskybacteria bacterium]|nr:hypothetical protein [Candidatus Yanofskybacteria bacterium]
MSGIRKWISLIWGLFVFFLVGAYLWLPRSDIWKSKEFPVLHSKFILLVLILAVLSHIFFRERPSKIGFKPDSLKKCFSERMEQVIGLSGLLIFCGFYLGRLGGEFFERGGFWFLVQYCIFGFAQQYVLNGFFVNRLSVFYGESGAKRIPFIAASAFSFLHFPNPLLCLATFIGGYFCAKIFLEYRNLYFLGLAHGLIGFFLFFAFPQWITASFATGIKFFYG